MLFKVFILNSWGRWFTAFVLVAGCWFGPVTAGATPPLAASASAPKSGPDACGASRVRHLVGKAATPELRREVAATSGAKAIRWLMPDTMATMDYSEDRLNVMLRTDKTIDAVKCG